MVSEKFMINSDAGRIAAATYVGEAFARDNRLGRRDTLRLQLLTEETLGMIRAMLNEFYGQLWFEGDENRFEIHVEATASMNEDKKHDLMSVSRSGKNVAVKGFMNKLGELISNTLYDFGRVVDAYGTETMRYGIVSPPGIETPMVYNVMPVWSLKTYRENLKTDLNESDQAGQAWDEMEKSIVANLADDVIVGVKGDCIELVIVKNLKG